MRRERHLQPKIDRMKQIYAKEVLTGEITVADMAHRFGITPAGMKYHLRKEKIWIPADKIQPGAPR